MGKDSLDLLAGRQKRVGYGLVFSLQQGDDVRHTLKVSGGRVEGVGRRTSSKACKDCMIQSSPAADEQYCNAGLHKLSCR